jgi:hypothetical protein
METPKEIIDNVIYSIDWRKVKTFHTRLGIKWVYETKDGDIERIPTVSELREDLRQLLNHMIAENITYISYGNWVIFWDKEDNTSVGDVRVIFRLADFSFEAGSQRERLDAALIKALDNEDYEYAAQIRDQLKKENKINGK